MATKKSLFRLGPLGHPPKKRTTLSCHTGDSTSPAIWIDGNMIDKHSRHVAECQGENCAGWGQEKGQFFKSCLPGQGIFLGRQAHHTGKGQRKGGGSPAARTRNIVFREGGSNVEKKTRSSTEKIIITGSIRPGM